jgi:hypothetical protein
MKELLVMPVVDPNNPLSAIGASNDPSLTQRTVDNNKIVGLLGNKLAELTKGGIENRRLQAQTDVAAGDRNDANIAGRFAVQGLSQGLNTKGPDFLTRLEDNRVTDNQSKNSLSALNLARLGSRADINGKTALEVADPTAIQNRITPLDTAAASAGNTANVKQGKTIKRTRYYGADKQPLGAGFKEETTDEIVQEGQLKSDSPENVARVRGLMDQVAALLNNNNFDMIGDPQPTEVEGEVAITIMEDGADTPRRFIITE